MTAPLVKICGLTRAEDTALAEELGAAFTGFVFARKSPRFIEPAAAGAIPKGRSKRVGVFVNAPEEEILRAVDAARLDFIQLHGGESVETCRRLGPERLIKVLWPQAESPGSLQQAIDTFAGACAWFLLDAGSAGSGGTGGALEWAALRSLRFPKPWLLAGGLGPDTLAPALAALRPMVPDGVDINSMVELSPGIKNKSLVRKTFSVIQALQGGNNKNA
ncbi:MAG: phosphoribosylanthranilate isomerase [Methylobacteriaceae bacterium]|jgi:phosphoribosylanthranilate isomerase|nr:phosphoribosylanthranilate isomerase [Methylobacteriaceae bacterium]